MMHEKTRSRKSREMVPLKVNFEDQPSFVRYVCQAFFYILIRENLFLIRSKEEKKFPQIVKQYTRRIYNYSNEHFGILEI